ncbi:MAG: ABC transporter permease [Gemmatimonadota bacterium]|nr:ABC transporter permease [Gemmatimonadota bacterium]
MRQVWVVLRREYIERVKTKGFIIATIAMPVLMIGLIGLSAFLSIQAERGDRDIALVDLTGQLGEAVAAGMEAVGYDIELVDSDVDLQEMDRRVNEDEIEAYVVLDDLTIQEGTFAYRGTEAPGRVRAALFENVVVETVLELRLSFAGNTAGLQELLAGGRLSFESLGEEQSELERVSGMATGFAGAFLLYFTMLFYGAYVLRSVLDEKRNRVVEVVVSSISPWRLMLGKILGVGSMGLTQVGIWVGCAALIGLLGIPMIAANWPAVDVGELGQLMPGVGSLGLLLVFFLLGYFLYSSLFAAVGAMCSTEEEAQQAQFPVMMLLIIPFILQMTSIEGSGLAWMDWAALFPFFSPIMMYPRAVVGAVPWWMVGTSLVLMAAALIGTAWVAGRIYRVGILMQGKRPTLRELVRWIRQA